MRRTILLVVVMVLALVGVVPAASAALPAITSFSPPQGMVGTAVVLTGTDFTGATSVEFGTTAAAFTVDSATRITTSVPAGASTGAISVTTPGGTATSTTNFVVVHHRTVSLNLAGNKAKGTVRVSDGFGACALSVRVTLQRRNLHPVGWWGTFAHLTTGATGDFSTGGVREDGQYRARARAFTTPSGDRCFEAYSREVKN